MKKVWYVLISIMLAFNTAAINFTKVHQYTQMEKQITNEP